MSPKPLDAILSKLEPFIAITPKSREALESLMQAWTGPQCVVLGLTGVSCFAVGLASGRLMARPIWRRFTNVADIPSSEIGSTAPYLHGRVVSVSDGDTFRFWHVPTSLWHSSQVPTLDTNNEKVKVSNVTLAVRVCTIDTPETAKFGNSGQPFGDEAKHKLESLIQGRMVQLQILQKDQYGRAVAQVQYGRHWLTRQPKFVDEAMLQSGLAEVYQGTGAVYGRLGKDVYLQMQDKAQKARRGMWAQADRESAAEYKARIKAEG